MLIREIHINDAPQLVELIRKVESESNFMLFEAGERNITSEYQKNRIQSIQQESNSTIFVAETDGQLVGYLFAIGGSAKRNRHSAYVVVGVLNQFNGRGIRKQLFEALNQWAIQQGLHRIELTVMSHNERAIALYKKMGYEIEGVKRDSLYVSGKYVDEYYMGILI